MVFIPTRSAQIKMDRSVVMLCVCSHKLLYAAVEAEIDRMDLQGCWELFAEAEHVFGHDSATPGYTASRRGAHG